MAANAADYLAAYEADYLAADSSTMCRAREGGPSDSKLSNLGPSALEFSNLTTVSESTSCNLSMLSNLTAVNGSCDFNLSMVGPSAPELSNLAAINRSGHCILDMESSALELTTYTTVIGCGICIPSMNPSAYKLMADFSCSANEGENFQAKMSQERERKCIPQSIPHTSQYPPSQCPPS